MGKPLNTEATKWKTGEFQIGDAPNAHGLLYEHAKTIATLSIAFLGFSVGYVDKLVTLASFRWAIWALGGAWVLLVLSIILVLLGSVDFHKYLLTPPKDPTDTTQVSNYEKQHNRVSLQIGFAGLCLAAAAVAFAAFGGGVMAYSKPQIDASVAIQKSMGFLGKTFPQLNWSVESLIWDEHIKGYKTVLVDLNSKARHFVVVDRKSVV